MVEVPLRFSAYIPPTFELARLLPHPVNVLLFNAKLVTLLITIPKLLLVPVTEILSNVITLLPTNEIAALFELTKFMFLSEIFVQELKWAPLSDTFWIVPPDPAVVPVPVTWKLPVVLVISNPPAPPFEEILLKIQSKAPLLKFTA